MVRRCLRTMMSGGGVSNGAAFACRPCESTKACTRFRKNESQQELSLGVVDAFSEARSEPISRVSSKCLDRCPEMCACLSAQAGTHNHKYQLLSKLSASVPVPAAAAYGSPPARGRHLDCGKQRVFTADYGRQRVCAATSTARSARRSAVRRRRWRPAAARISCRPSSTGRCAS